MNVVRSPKNNAVWVMGEWEFREGRQQSEIGVSQHQYLTNNKVVLKADSTPMTKKIIDRNTKPPFFRFFKSTVDARIFPRRSPPLGGSRIRAALCS